jgi:low affinity Fe/Cu permease
VTFWMVFVIQNSANRSSKATQLKLDELIRSLKGARNEFIELDTATEAELARHEEEFHHLVEDPPPVEADSPPAVATGAETSQAMKHPSVERNVEGSGEGQTQGMTRKPSSPKPKPR